MVTDDTLREWCDMPYNAVSERDYQALAMREFPGVCSELLLARRQLALVGMVVEGKLERDEIEVALRLKLPPKYDLGFSEP